MNKLDDKIIQAAELAGQRFVLSLNSRFAGFQGGGKFGRGTGQSLEFVEHREYQPGDDLRHVDWSAVARSDRLSIKLFREEITPHADIFIDLSASMAVNDEKLHGLQTMTAIMRRAAFNSGYSCDSWLIKDLCKRVEPSSLPLEKWPDFNADYTKSAGDTLENYLPKLKNGAVRVIISDLFWNQDPMTILQRFTSGSSAVIVIQIVSERDIEPEVFGNVRVVDSESGEAVELIADEALIDEYKQNFERHRQYWKECCTRTGAIFNFCIAEKFMKDYMPSELIENGVLTARS